jgi:hypothetical protein
VSLTKAPHMQDGKTISLVLDALIVACGSMVQSRQERDDCVPLKGRVICLPHFLSVPFQSNVGTTLLW